MLEPTSPIEPADRRWVNVDLSGARFHNIDLTGARITGAWVRDVEIDGEIESLIVNGIDVGPYVDQQLRQRHPELALVWSDDPDDLRHAWQILRTQWGETETEVARMDESLLHQQVDDEYSYVETLRHLVFATDGWVRRCLLGRDDMWPGGLPHSEIDAQEAAALPIDPGAHPTLDEVMLVRRDRLAVVEQILAELTADRMREHPPRRETGGYPLDTSARSVGDCVRCVLNEEWWHRRFAVRDLAKLTGG